MGWSSVSTLIYLTVMSSGGLCPFWTVITTLSIEFTIWYKGIKFPPMYAPHRTINLTWPDKNVTFFGGKCNIIQKMLDRGTFSRSVVRGWVYLSQHLQNIFKAFVHIFFYYFCSYISSVLLIMSKRLSGLVLTGDLSGESLFNRV